MKTLRTFLRPLLAALLALASLPAAACARTCSSQSAADLACVRVCAHSQALLTQGGKLPSLGAQACGVQFSSGPSALSVAAFELAQPQVQGLAVPAPAAAPQAVEPPAAAAGRAPPPSPQPLLCRAARAHAPPSCC